jgi:hypothetical protein
MRLKRPWPTGLPSLYGTSDDFGANPGFQSFNFGGIGMSPWMQPRLDSSLLGLQPDMYQAISAAAFQNTMKQVSPTVLQFQQPQNIAGRSALLSSQILQQVQPQFQQMHHQHINDSAIQGHNQSEYLQQQLQRCQSFNEQNPPPPQQQQQQQQESHQQQQQESLQQQLQRCQSFNGQNPPLQPQQELHHLQQQESHHQQQQQQQQQESHQQQQSQCVRTPQHQQMQEQKHSPEFHSVPNALSFFSQLSSNTQSPPSTLQTVSEFSQQQNFQDTDISSLSPSNISSMHDTLRPFPSEAGSNLQGVARTTPSPVSDPWSSKRVAVESAIPSRSHANSSRLEQFDSVPSTIPQSSSLAPLPGRECLLDQDGSSDHQNHLLFGVNIDSQSLLMQGSIPSLQNDADCIASLQDEDDSSTLPYSTCNFLSPSQNDFPLNEALTSSGCLDESEYVPFSENSDKVNRPPATFVKVNESTCPLDSINLQSCFI